MKNKYLSIASIMLLIMSSMVYAKESVSTQFIIVNNSNFQLNKIESDSDGMQWDFPRTIKSNETVQTRVEFKYPWFFGSIFDDKGSVGYQVNCNNGTENISIHTQFTFLSDKNGAAVYVGFPFDVTGANCVKPRGDGILFNNNGVPFVQDGTSTLTINNS